MAETKKQVDPQKVDYNDAVAQSKIYFDGDELAAAFLKGEAGMCSFLQLRNIPLSSSIPAPDKI